MTQPDSIAVAVDLPSLSRLKPLFDHYELSQYSNQAKTANSCWNVDFTLSATFSTAAEAQNLSDNMHGFLVAEQCSQPFAADTEDHHIVGR